MPRDANLSAETLPAATSKPIRLYFGELLPSAPIFYRYLPKKYEHFETLAKRRIATDQPAD